MMTGSEGMLSAAPAVTVIADDAASAALANEAAILAGGRLLSSVRWADATDMIGRQSNVRLVLAETRDVADEMLASRIESVAGAARAANARLVVALDECQIDVVAGQLLDARPG